MPTVHIPPVRGLAGALRVPSDKSITHRAIMLAAVSDRAVTVRDSLDSADTAATLAAMEACGVAVDGHLGDQPMVITGRGLRGLRPRRPWTASTPAP
ncbi:MAG: hypothetical protein U0Y82_08170 [Thermoleophilia bacterium]